MKQNKEAQGLNYFSSRTIGRTLREVAVDLIQMDTEDVVSRWFHSQPAETDLYTWVDRRQNILKQQLSFYGQIVEWNCVEGIKTGVVIESELEATGAPKKEEALQVNPSETIQFDSKPQPKTVELAVEILNHMEEADTIFKQQLVENFKHPQNIQSLGEEAFIQRFGLNLKNYQTNDHGFWDAMKKRIQSLFRK